MATARKIYLSPSDTGIFSARVKEHAAETVNEVLQDNLEKHHVFFNNKGFHNHIVHHVLTIYALGASPELIRDSYVENKQYQNPALQVNEAIVRSLYEKQGFKENLGKGNNYPNYLEFFQREIEGKGVEHVLNQYVFAGDENAEAMMIRLFAGLLHPIIHLGFGLEFNQPAIVAEALSQAAVHDDALAKFLFPAEKAAGGLGKEAQKKPLLQILEGIRTNEKLVHSVRWEDDSKMRDGVLIRALDEMIETAAQVTVSEDEIDERTAEMINTVVYYTAAAQRRSKKVKFDFFFLHCVNVSIFFPKIMALSWIDVRSRVRLLEWKIRMDLLIYVSGGSPGLHLEDINKYQTAHDWSSIFEHGNVHTEDDGHFPKLARALANGEKACRPFESQGDRFKITGDAWLKIGNMVMDSTPYAGAAEEWVRFAGFDEAWREIEDRPRL
ncbi:hypothetical protein FE257_010288 [Aspergillus nanangensis]|uniref:HypA-like protein n=1 Tax=Aspergillus nanangensis TaxID=2582783 RepID=A0AAD4GTC5_ASPNN|nr:hypothetical protein FE257_010288 [Aspergillus nanangensis]